MANTLLPIEERNLTPDEVEALDRRRRRGQLFLVVGFQCLIIAGAVVGLRLRNTVADSVLAAVMIAIVLTYIGVGYSSVNVSPEVAFESAPPVGGKLL